MRHKTLMKKFIKRRLLIIRNFKMGIEGRLAHNIAQNKFIGEPDFCEENYLMECEESLLQVGLNPHMVKSIIINTRQRADEDYRIALLTGSVSGFGGSQIKPLFFAEQVSLVILREIDLLNRLAALRKKHKIRQLTS